MLIRHQSDLSSMWSLPVRLQSGEFGRTHVATGLIEIRLQNINRAQTGRNPRRCRQKKKCSSHPARDQGDSFKLFLYWINARRNLALWHRIFHPRTKDLHCVRAWDDLADNKIQQMDTFENMEMCIFFICPAFAEHYFAFQQ